MLQEIISFFKQINKILLASIGVTFVFLIIVSIFNLKRHGYDAQIFYIWIMFLLNSSLSIYFYPKDKIIPYIFIASTIIVEILTLALINYY